MPETNPYANDTRCLCPDDWREPFDKTRCPQHGGAAYESVRAKAYREGAAAGVAASEARVRERADRLAAFLADHFGIDYPEDADGCYDKSYWDTLARGALAALLSEEPGLQESTTTDTRSDA